MAQKVGGNNFIFLKISSLHVGYEWIAAQAIDANAKPYNQSNLQKKIYSEGIFIEIIVIIVKEHLQRLCNKSFEGSIAYLKLKEYFNICRKLLFECQE